MSQEIQPSISLVGLTAALAASPNTKSASEQDLQIEKEACAECNMLYGPSVVTNSRMLQGIIEEAK